MFLFVYLTMRVSGRCPSCCNTFFFLNWFLPKKKSWYCENGILKSSIKFAICHFYESLNLPISVLYPGINVIYFMLSASLYLVILFLIGISLSPFTSRPLYYMYMKNRQTLKQIFTFNYYCTTVLTVWSKYWSKHEEDLFC